MLNPGDELTICHRDHDDILVRVTTTAVYLLPRYEVLDEGRYTGTMRTDPEAGLCLAHAQVAEVIAALSSTTTEQPKGEHCPTCICGRRAPVQGERGQNYRPPRASKPAGTITWAEHLEAWGGYNARYPGQSAERMAERGGFSWYELCDFLGHEPKTWTVAR
jgi:hypothetical protein